MTPGEFRTLYPSFSANSDFQIQTFLDLFINLYATSYGSISDHLQGLYTAHRLTVADRGAAITGAIASRSVGDVSVSYENGSSNGSGFYSTAYGIEFMDLLSKFSTPIVANAI